MGEICSINEAQECVPDKPISMPYRHEFTGESMGWFGVYNVCGARYAHLVGVGLFTRQPELDAKHAEAE